MIRLHALPIPPHLPSTSCLSFLSLPLCRRSSLLMGRRVERAWSRIRLQIRKKHLRIRSTGLCLPHQLVDVFVPDIMTVEKVFLLRYTYNVYMIYRSLEHSRVYSEFRIRIRIDCRLDPDPDPGGQKRQINIEKKVKEIHVLKCWMFLLRGEGFCCSLDVLYWGLKITKL